MKSNTHTPEQAGEARIATRPVSEFPRLAFSLNETAEMLGLSYITIYRLVQRGKLKSSGSLRTKLITRQEIDRFLRV